MRYSKECIVIKEALIHDKSHPTADLLYISLKKDNPKLSLGTVYRNLNKLAENREILRLRTEHGPDRFDGTTTPHYHAECSVCGSLVDMNIAYLDGLDVDIERQTGLKINSHRIVFDIICKKCLRRNK